MMKRGAHNPRPELSEVLGDRVDTELVISKLNRLVCRSVIDCPNQSPLLCNQRSALDTLAIGQ